MINKFRSLIENFSEFWIGCIAIEIGILEVINRNNEMCPRDISELKNWDELTIEALCNCLVAYGYLKKKGDLCSLTDLSKKYLLKDSKEYLGFFFESIRSFNILSEYTDHIKHGKRLLISDRSWETMTRLSSLAGEDMFKALLENFPALLDGKHKILDLGCGRMPHSIQLAKDNPNISIVGVESSRTIVDHVNEKLKKSGLTNQIKIIHDDVKNYDTESRFDVIFINHLLHCLDHETNTELIKKTRKWLTKHGKLVIFEDLLNDDKLSPVESVKKNLLVRCLNSKVYTISELKKLSSDANFNNITCIPLNRRIIVFGEV